MQLQCRTELRKYITSQKTGDSRSNRLLAYRVKKVGVIHPQAMLRESMAKKASNGKTKSCGCLVNKENMPVSCRGLQSGHVPNMGSANIDKIVQFIEGGAQDEAAFKKAEKKARQKQKKDEERRQREEEEEALRKAEEARIRREQEIAEQQRIKEEQALQKQLKKIQKKNQLQQQPTPPPPSESKSSKKKKQKQPQPPPQQQQVEETDSDLDSKPDLFEQTIPAMVTIKRVVENNNSPPTVTITLKGSTPDQDKLLYTLVNGHDAPIFNSRNAMSESSSTKQAQDQQQSNKSGKSSGNNNSNSKQINDKQTKKKSKGNANVTQASSVTNGASTKNKENVTVQTSEIKVQLAIESSFRKDLQKSQKKQLEAQQQHKQTSKNKSSTIAVKEVKTAKDVKKTQNHPNSKTNKSTNSSTTSLSSSASTLSSQEKAGNQIIDIPSIKLPPGITITKVNGPLANRKTSTTPANEYPDVPVSKSGVIVVDTEKLIQQSSSTSSKKKKKAKKAAAASETLSADDKCVARGASVTIVNAQNGGQRSEPRVVIKSSDTSASTGMVTLKNPIFHPLQGMQKPPSCDSSGESMPQIMNMNEQATISQGENGMVTIRRPRPVGFMPSNESSISEYLAKTGASSSSGTGVTSMATVITNSSPLKTNMGAVISTVPPPSQSTNSPPKQNPPILTPWQMPDTSFSALSEDRKIIRPPGVQWPRTDYENGKITTPSVLQGLPGIEITRVKQGSAVVEQDLVEAPANVSIIRTGGYTVTDNAQNWAYSAQP